MEVVSSLRASDADREQVAERLRHAAAEGRLDAGELEERLQRLFAARTYGELDGLLADLPSGRSVGRQRVRVPRWPAAIGAFALMLAVLSGLAITRLHSAVAVRVAVPGGGRQFKLRPPLEDPNHALIVAMSVVGAFALLVLCGVLLWVLMRSRDSVGRLNEPPS